MKYSLRQLGEMFEVDHKTVSAALSKCGLKTGKGSRFSVRQVHDAMTQKADSKGSIQEERLRKIRLENEILEQERDENARTLVPIARVQELVGRYTGPIRNAWITLPEAMASRCNPTDPDLAKKALNEWVNTSLRLTQSEFTAGMTHADEEEEAEVED